MEVNIIKNWKQSGKWKKFLDISQKFGQKGIA
jgi:hypothetical protein